MADTVTPAPPYIDSGTFRRFAAAKTVNLTCPLCNSPHQSLVTTEANRVVALVDAALVAPDLGDLRPVNLMMLECVNCGYSRLFRRETIENWLRENP